MISVTRRMIQCLKHSRNTDQVIEAAALNRRDERERIKPDTKEIIPPGEEGYERDLLDIETGAERLKPVE